MTIYQARGKPASLQIALRMPLISLTIGAINAISADPNYQSIGNSDICLITFAAAHVDKSCVAQHEISEDIATRNLYAALKSVHKNPFH